MCLGSSDSTWQRTMGAKGQQVLPKRGVDESGKTSPKWCLSKGILSSASLSIMTPTKIGHSHCLRVGPPWERRGVRLPGLPCALPCTAAYTEVYCPAGGGLEIRDCSVSTIGSSDGRICARPLSLDYYRCPSWCLPGVLSVCICLCQSFSFYKDNSHTGSGTCQGTSS